MTPKTSCARSRTPKATRRSPVGVVETSGAPTDRGATSRATRSSAKLGEQLPGELGDGVSDSAALVEDVTYMPALLSVVSQASSSGQGTPVAISAARSPIICDLASRGETVANGAVSAPWVAVAS